MNQYPQSVTPSTSTSCTAPGCRINPTADAALVARMVGEDAPARHAVQGTDLCNWHQAQFPRILKDLVTLWPDLEAALYKRASSDSNERVQSSGVVDLSQSWNPAASEIMADITEWTAMLVRTVLAGFQLPEDAAETKQRNSIKTNEDGSAVVLGWTETRTTVHAHAAALTKDAGTRLRLSILARHYARWLTSYPGIGPDALASAHEHRYAAGKAIDSAPVRRVRLGSATCGHIVEDPELGPVSCMAPMVAVFPTKEDARPSVMMCTVHPKTHPQFSKAEWMTWGTTDA